MEQVQKAVIPALAALACASLGCVWLARSAEGGSGQGGIGDSTLGAETQQTERMAARVTQAPSRPESMTALPQVSAVYRGGLLTIKARGASLGEVLAEITRTVGVTFALSEDAGERLSIDLGPRPAREVISSLLDRTSYGYAFIDSPRGAGGSGPAKVFLFKQGTSRDARGAARATSTPPILSAPAGAVEQPSPPDEKAMQQQRAVDAVFEACRNQACDTS